jgi:heat shock protein HslJ
MHRNQSWIVPAVLMAICFAATGPGTAAPGLEAMGNIAYSGIHETPVTLVNGLYEGEPFVPEGAARPRVELLADLYVTGDVDGDSVEDAWVLLNESSGGTGQMLYLAAVSEAGGSPRNIATIAIGDRVKVMGLKAEGGAATLTYVAPGPQEPACCPTQMISGVYGLADGTLTELAREDLGTLSLEQLQETTWRLQRFAWDQHVPDGASITAVFEDDRVSGSAGCNRYFAKVSARSPYDLDIGPAGSTRMACPPPQAAAEQRYLRALTNATQYSFVLGKLAISYRLDDDHGTLIFERAATD